MAKIWSGLGWWSFSMACIFGSASLLVGSSVEEPTIPLITKESAVFYGDKILSEIKADNIVSIWAEATYPGSRCPPPFYVEEDKMAGILGFFEDAVVDRYPDFELVEVATLVAYTKDGYRIRICVYSEGATGPIRFSVHGVRFVRAKHLLLGGLDEDGENREMMEDAAFQYLLKENYRYASFKNAKDPQKVGLPDRPRVLALYLKPFEKGGDLPDSYEIDPEVEFPKRMKD